MINDKVVYLLSLAHWLQNMMSTTKLEVHDVKETGETSAVVERLNGDDRVAKTSLFHQQTVAAVQSPVRSTDHRP